jgi:LacI family transcriptional regulator
MRKITLKELSAITGYSVTTISRVLSGKGKESRVSEEAIERIFSEAQKYNYKPNIFAQTLRTTKTNSIALLVPSLSNSYFANIASIVIKTAYNYNYRVSIYDTLDNQSREEEIIDSVTNQNVDGLIVVPSGRDASYIEHVREMGIPVVLLDRHYDNTQLQFVATDNYRGGCMATEMLVRNGHKKILCLQGIAFSSPNRERVNGYIYTMTRFGLQEYTSIAGDDFSFESGYVQTKLAMNSENRPTALFTLSNTILFGALKALKESDIKIPEEVSIVSFDNAVYLDYLDPAITRISQPAKEMGALAFEMLLKLIDGKTIESLRLTPQLIIGESIRNLYCE